jgi:hypothetical protein
MRSRLAALGFTAALVAVPLVTAIPAHASSCNTNAQWMATSAPKGYTCGDYDHSGSQSIGAGKTHTYTATTSGQSINGNYMFSLYYCYYRSTTAITVAQASAFNSMSATATNWLTPSNTRHWAAGILWAMSTPSVNKGQYSSGCSSSGTISNNLLYNSTINASQVTPTLYAGVPATFTLQATPTTGVGQALLCVNQASDQPTMPKYTTACGSVSGYVGLGEPVSLTGGVGTFTFTPSAVGTFQLTSALKQGTNAMPVQGPVFTVNVVAPPTQPTPTPTATATTSPTTTAAALASKLTRIETDRSNAVPGLNIHVVEASGAMPGSIVANCPTGSSLIHADTVTNGKDDVPLNMTATGASIGRNSAIDGQNVTLQAVCRESSARPIVKGLLGYGSTQADTLSTTGKRGHVFGGLGNDTLSVTQEGGLAFGGLGNDSITVSVKDGVAVGGPGNDVLRAKGSGRIMLEGGPGNDTFFGGSGNTYINARDGKGGDVITCTSSKNIVIADAGDKISGPCTIAGR